MFGNTRFFQFQESKLIENAQFPKELQEFRKQGIAATVRENIQNSMDAKLDNFDGPVKVEIVLDEIKKKDIPGIDEIFEHIDSLVGGNDYTQNHIDFLKTHKNKQEKILTITFEDNNTKGLKGANIKGEPITTYEAYAYKRGIHPKVDDKKLEERRGGSHGVGKIANNSASAINLMYFANCDENGDKHLGGNIKLIEHKLNGQIYRDTGYFAELRQDNLFAFPNDRFHKIFDKPTRGLKTIIPYALDEFYNDKEIVRVVCDSFFLALLEKKLEVRIKFGHIRKKITINKEMIQQLLNNRNFFKQDIKDMKNEFTKLYVDTYQNKKPIPLTVKSKNDSYHFDLYFNYDPEIPKGRVAIMRNIGMKIADFKIIANANKPFNAVLIGGQKEDKFLKSLENESHTTISADLLPDAEAKQNATRFINNLSKEIARIIQEKEDELNPTEGFLDTSDILYQSVNSFRSQLRNRSTKVELSSGNSVRKQNKVKNCKKEKRGSRTTGDSKATTPTRTQVRTPKKWQPGGSIELDDKETFIISNNSVSRIIAKNTEYLRIDLSNYSDKGYSYCDLGFKIVDGQGKEINDSFNVASNYDSAINVHTDDRLEITDSNIKNIEIINSEIFIRSFPSKSFNKNLKFIFKVVMYDDI